MTDRLTSAFQLLREGGAVFAGRARLTGWSDSSRGMLASFRLDASADPLDNPSNHPFKGAYCSPKDGHEFMVLVIPVANTDSVPEPERDCHGGTTTAETPKRDLNMASKAAMFCQEKDARGGNLACTYFAEVYPREWGEATGRTDVERADACLKLILGIKSKCDLDTDPDAETEFERIRKDLHRWRNEEVRAA